MKSRHLLKKVPLSPRRGAMLVLVAAMLLVFVGIIAFSVDVAYMQLARTELQTATDAAARAATAELSRAQNVNQARKRGIAVAAMNTVDGRPLKLRPADVVPGYSMRPANSRWKFAPNQTPINSFRVAGRKTNQSPSGSVKLFFAPVFGKKYFELQQTASAVRMDRDIALVVDRSGSMKVYTTEKINYVPSGDWRRCSPPQPKSRWAALTTAVQVFVRTLQQTPSKEQIGLVSYASSYKECGIVNRRSEVNQPLTLNGNQINSAMNAISARAFNGATDISAGIDEGMNMLLNSPEARSFAQRTIVLMTDGVWNQGRSPVQAAQDARRRGISIYTVTFGAGANQNDMKKVAQITGGKHYHAPDEQTLIQVFQEIALTLSVTLTE